MYTNSCFYLVEIVLKASNETPKESDRERDVNETKELDLSLSGTYLMRGLRTRDI